jgi:Adenylate cyclase, family 3 (some proteins contain HAMP domain)
MIRRALGRYIRYWYTYRTAVAVLLALVLTMVMYFLYTQQVACDTQGSCAINIAVHPEDRFVNEDPLKPPSPKVVIVGIDDQSVQTIGTYPVPRDRYATALQNLEKDGAAVVAFDVSFPDSREKQTDDLFAKALADSTIPVILSYAAESTDTGNDKVIQTGIDQIPFKKFRCTDQNPDPKLPCQQPDKNVTLASTDLRLDADGVVRRIPLFVQPACFPKICDTPLINTFGFAAYRAWFPGITANVQESGNAATFPEVWKGPMQIDDTGAALIKFYGGPDYYQRSGQYVSFGDLINGTVSPDAIKDNIVLVGYYHLSGVNDQQLVTTSAGQNGAGKNATTAMAGVELHANVVQMLLAQTFLIHEPPLLVFLTLLLIALLMAVVVARVSVLWGLLATVVALVLFTYAMSTSSAFSGFVPDLFHPWLAIALTYTGVTAYRFLYEDREKRKVTAIFGQYLKPEIVAQLAKTRGGVDDILRGGERREITLLFVDVRGFTSMSERMEADDVVSVVQMYLDHLSGIIFTWDGTVDKYVGDEIVAFWNAPRLQENHALLAVRCAYDLISRAPELQAKLIAKGLPPIRWGIGVNTGPAVVGNLGSRSRLQYTALGDTVNTAARFCANAPAYHLLIGQPTYDMCKDYIAVDMVPGVQLKGKSAETFRIYQVTAIRETPTSPWVEFPTEMATEAHQTYTQQYTQQTILAAGNSASRDILVGEAAQQVLSDQAAVAPTPPYGTPTQGPG